eukprot:GHUV01004459.1.p1 GENE.GHUV01004459.1~~GHUV01004459.1.p1  ORF type:complete len:388 (+),score=73.09 GHUV01004459.1:58-1221(+)
MNMARRKQTAVSVALPLALLLGIGYSSAYPIIWQGLTKDCQAVPEQSYGPHPAPLPDAASLMTVKRLSSTVLKMCPGMAHKLQVAFPEPRQYVLTSNQGSFPSPSSNCPNRAVSTVATQNVDLSLTLPCDAAGSVKLQMVSVASPGNKQYNLFTTTLPVNHVDACPQSPCRTAESGSLTITKDVPAQSKPAAAVNPSAPAAAAPAPTPAAPKGPIEINLMDLLKLPGQKKDGGDAKGLLGGLNLLGGLAAGAGAPDTGAATTLPGIPQLPKINPLQVAQQLGNVNATAVLTVLKSLGKLVDGHDAPEGTPKFNLESVMQFMHTVGQIMPNAATAQSSAAPDLPTAVLSVLKSMGKLLPSDKPADVMAVVGFVKSVSDLFGKLSAMRS